MVAACAFSVVACGAASAQVTLLGNANFARAVSSDGRVVAGQNSQSQKAFVWTAAAGRYDFGLDPDMPTVSNALAVSANGDWVVGGSSQGAFRWHGTGTYESIVNLPPPFTGGTATGVSADGNSVCGWSGPEAFGSNGPWYWTESGGFRAIPVNNARAVGISRNGAVVVGQTSGDLRGFTWTPAGGVHVLQPPAGSSFPDTSAAAINFDGTVVVGWSGGGAPTMWRNEVPGTLPVLAGFSFLPTCLNDAGTVVGGWGTGSTAIPQAIIWTQARGTELFTTYLASFGISFPAGVGVDQLTGMSSDGTMFIGRCHTSTFSQGFVVAVPAPACITLAAMALGMSACRRRPYSTTPRQSP